MDNIQMIKKIHGITYMPLSIYSMDMQLKERFCENENTMLPEQMDAEKLKKCFESLTEHDNAFLEDEDAGIGLGMIRFGNLVLLLGPYHEAEKKAAGSGPSRKILKYEDLFLPEYEIDEAFRIMEFLYESLTGNPITLTQIWNRSPETARIRKQTEEQLHNSVFASLEEVRPHHSYTQEQRLLDKIRSGDEAGLEQMLGEPVGGCYGILAKDQLRSDKNIAICSITLYARAAAEGGLNFELALTMSDGYILQIENAQDSGKVAMIVHYAALEYAKRVKNNQSVSQIHLLVEKCQNLIYSQITRKISVSSLARELSVNPDYLSRLFHERTGMTISEFCQTERVKLAKNMLVYSDYSLEKIAYYLGFSSQSHFGRVFKKHTGMSPGYYRQAYKLPEFWDGQDKILNLENK